MTAAAYPVPRCFFPFTEERLSERNDHVGVCAKTYLRIRLFCLLYAVDGNVSQWKVKSLVHVGQDAAPTRQSISAWSA